MAKPESPSKTLAEQAAERNRLIRAVGAVQPLVVPEPRRSVIAPAVETPPLQVAEPAPKSVEKFDMTYFFDELANGYN